MRWIAVVAICLVSLHARAEDWGVRRDPFDADVVRRYKALLERDPHDRGALDALVTMYKRYRSLATLESEYRAQLAAAESWPTLVVLARLPRASRTDTVAWWNRALKVNQSDSRGWLAIGDLAPDASAARDAYKHAAQHAGSPRDKRTALRKLVDAARSVGDVRTVDASYVELIALAPKDGLLWLERGDAQVAGGLLADAIDSFTTAESLLAKDPERRVTAMMNLGIVYERLDRTDDAIAQYVRTLDKLPRGYFLGREIVPRIVTAERRRGRLEAAIALFDTRWPQRSRGYFEWVTLGDLYKEARDHMRALDAYERAVAKAPTEIDTWRKVIALLDTFHPSEALAKHEAAARIAPGDANLQIDLAKRYYPMDKKKALATLDRLAKRMSKNINVRRTLAELYSQWEQPDRTIREYEAIAAIEPTVPDHAIVLGQAYWQAGDETKARAAWRRLAAIGTPVALFRQGEVLAMHELWDDAAVAYTSSLSLDATKPETWRGRARVYLALERFADAVADAQRSVALIGHATHDKGDRERNLLVRALGDWQKAYGTSARFSYQVARWRFAFERGDVGAGYLLAAHHARIGGPQRHDVLVELYRRVPADDSLGLEVARSFSRRKEFSRAREELERIAKRTPARAEDIGKLLVQLAADRKHAELEARWAEEGISARERAARVAAGRTPDLVGTRRRFGARLSLGADVRHASSALLGLGLYRTHRVATGTAIPVRLEWTQRDDQMEEVNAIATSVGMTRRILDARRFELAAGIAPRLELRYGSDASNTSWDRFGFGGDVTLEMLPRAVPATVGVRFHQSFTDAARPSALVVELGFEVR